MICRTGQLPMIAPLATVSRGNQLGKVAKDLRHCCKKQKKFLVPFDYVLVEADYLLARSDSEIVKFVDALAQYGVGVYFVSTKMYSTDPVFRLLFNIKKAMEEHYISSLRQKPRSRKPATVQRPESRCH
jgi:DNA invertase Pin-like site-specific DNA recombinase